ncbi:MAG: DivIVA domain-containing protein [Deltaproteobacteria bacterium]|nr:DivIVA domain-containing protein [Deltaproteobacteria bacterium]MBW2420194.1 DivIVA domain-containing protein [Deltaproteobacteria bacterium]
MRITPLEVQNHHFSRRFSGLDPDEVETFLRMVAEDYESLMRENEVLAEKALRLEGRVEELVGGERILRETLVSAQSMSEDLRQSAAREAEVLISEAEVRAEKILDASHRRAARLAEEIREMRGVRTRLAAALRASIQSHLNLVDHLEEAPEEADSEADAKVTYLGQNPGNSTADSSGSS